MSLHVLPTRRSSDLLRWLLGINALLFVVEMTAGLIAQSTGLIGESLDNFADAAVYGLALYAVGHSVKRQVRVAHVAGVVQLVLAVGVLVEVVRRFVFGSEPESLVMIAIAFVALIANTACLLMVSKHREGGAHMKASWIFSANDVVINLGRSEERRVGRESRWGGGGREGGKGKIEVGESAGCRSGP